MKSNRQIPQICHYYWGRDKPLSWLRWLTVKTFAMLNPDWRVIVWSPRNAGSPPPWKTKEHVHYTWEGEDWLKRISEAGANVEAREAPIGDFPALSEVHRSDLLRWRLLHTMGGFWSDIDIIYFRPMTELQADMTADALLCWGETDELKDWQAIGFLAGAPGCKLFKEMEQVGLALTKTPNLGYQDLGTHLLNRFALPGATEAAGSRIGQISQYAVYPFKTVKGQMGVLWNRHQELDLRESTIGVHWFAAQRLSCIKEASWTGFEDVERERRCGGVKWALQQTGLVTPGEGDSGLEYNIIMPYMDRPVLLHNTLVSLYHWYGARDDWEIIIVQDSKCAYPADLQDVVDIWTRRGLDIRVVDQEAPDSYGPSLLFNRGVAECRGRYIILTSPEIYHEANILAGLDKEFEANPDQYVICSCMNRTRPRVNRKIKRYGDLQGEASQWIQHSVHRPARYHFCSALSKALYLQAGGFDERFAAGFCFDDDDFRESVIKAGIPITQRDDLLTTHQWHGHCAVPDKMARWNRNKALYESKHGPYHTSAEAPVKPDTEAMTRPRRPGRRSVAVLCVLKSGGYFTPEYVIRLKNMVERHTTVIHQFICLTDFPGIHGCSFRALTADLPGWWSKIELFRPDIAAVDRIVYFDLDTLILDNIDDLLELDGPFYALRPWNRKNLVNGQCGSGLMTWQAGAYEYLFTGFERSWMARPLGDQAYISAVLREKGEEFTPIQDAIPGIYSYKRECRRGGLPDDARIICFHGRPRVHEVKDAWVREAWR